MYLDCIGRIKGKHLHTLQIVILRYLGRVGGNTIFCHDLILLLFNVVQSHLSSLIFFSSRFLPSAIRRKGGDAIRHWFVGHMVWTAMALSSPQSK